MSRRDTDVDSPITVETTDGESFTLPSIRESVEAENEWVNSMMDDPRTRALFGDAMCDGIKEVQERHYREAVDAYGLHDEDDES